ncbi:MAG TPA: threonine--tRNA ligase [Thermoanaerobacterales bacterium]|nr:threonine--tRNA ligase [Thermoanaerobacterales bacterium]
MQFINVTLKDNSKMTIPCNTKIVDFIKEFMVSLNKKAIAAKVDGKAVDLSAPLYRDCKLEILTYDDEEGKKIYRHSASHILAQAVKRLYPNVKLGIGPAIENGFYYDFDTENPFTPEDLEQIEEEMKSIIKEDLSFERIIVNKEEAIKIFKEHGEIYKIELIENLPQDAEISLYKQGDFVDLCAGPHVLSTGKIKVFKLLSLAGAYWRGDERNKMLQRIYGTAFLKKKDMDQYLNRIEEAKKRDHRKLGKELDLFSLQDEGPGFPFFHPKGMVIRNKLEDFWRKEHNKRGYQEIKSPIILHESLWRQSGHWDHYRENMYFTSIDNEKYAVKPMNCPGSMLIYKRKIHSYRDLPLRYAELGLVHRHELSGALHGLMRVRCFTQDDAHIFMLDSQVTDEIIGVIDLVDYFYKVFGFKYYVELSTKPENAMGSDLMWEKATDALRKALEIKGLNYKTNEGDGAFYGPKIDFHLEDSIGRTWQCGTIQLDFQMPERFDLTYIGSDGEKHRPVMIHRVIFGSIERFIGILTEHFAGAFPLWLAPVQVKIIPITQKNHEYTQKVSNELKEKDIRVETDYRNEKVGYKIRESQLEKIPYMLIIGDKEEKQGTVSVRSRKEGDIGTETVKDFMIRVLNEVENKIY